MIKYKIDIIKKLKEKGYTTYRIRKEKLIGENTLTLLRQGSNEIKLSTLEKLCKLLDCQPSDIIEYVPDNADTQ